MNALINILGPSWKTRVSAILSLIGPAGLGFILVTFCKVQLDQATAISTAVFVVLASFGLYNSKQVDVSNAPVPMAVAQPVALAPVTAPTPTK